MATGVVDQFNSQTRNEGMVLRSSSANRRSISAFFTGVHRHAAALADAGRLPVDQLAARCCCAFFDSNRHAVDGEGLAGSNNLVDTVRCASRVELWAGDLIPKPRDHAAVNVVIGKDADNGCAMIGFIAGGDYF